MTALSSILFVCLKMKTLFDRIALALLAFGMAPGAAAR